MIFFFFVSVVGMNPSHEIPTFELDINKAILFYGELLLYIISSYIGIF